MTASRRALSAIAALCLLLVGSPPGAAEASTTPRPPVSRWRGTTSQGRVVTFTIVGKPGQRALRDIMVAGIATCEETGSSGPGRFVYRNFDVPLDHGTVAFDDVFWFTMFHLHGTFGAVEASGTARWGTAQLVDEANAESCETGTVTWTAQRVASTTAASTARADATRAITLGGRTVSLATTTAADPEAVAFAGRTTQGRRVGFDVVGPAGSRQVTDLTARLDLICPPEAEQRWTLWLHTTDPLPVAGGAFEVPPIEWPFLIARFGGTVAGAEASGTGLGSIATYTPADEAVACTSGQVGWSAERLAGGSARVADAAPGTAHTVVVDGTDPDVVAGIVRG